jgi:DNA-binding LytR/AlgR family response regulator
MEYKIILCDDEKLHREILSNEIVKHFADSQNDYEIIKASSGEEVLGYDEINTVDIAFLDIELEDMKGIELSRKLRAINDKVLIIFVTSHSGYAVEAFEQFAFNYLTKPIDDGKFKRVIGKALRTIEDQSDDKHFKIIHKREMISIPYRDIIYFKKTVNNLEIVLENDRLKTRSSLKNVEENIDMDYFLRCHNSYIVNRKKIVKQKGNMLFLYGCDDGIDVGRKYKDNVLSEISRMIRGTQI